MSKINKEIKDNFEIFKELMDKKKVIQSDTIQLVPKNNNVRWLIGKSNVKHSTIDKEITLFVERSNSDLKYGLKLRCPSLTEFPFFRFDSDGPAHRNDSPEIPLEKQLITTPHFNSYQKNGKSIAYKNETLKKENESNEIAKDINFGVSLFCMESNSELHNGNYPEVVDKAPEINFGEIEEVNFDNITFE